jgi:hypothetical protein
MTSDLTKMHAVASYRPESRIHKFFVAAKGEEGEDEVGIAADT